jgi:hypothetical protein
MERIKRGKLREDGMVFWAYDKKRPNGERWISKERFEEKMKRNREKLMMKSCSGLNKKFSCGYVREDGMVFFRYNRLAKNGEVWITKERLNEISAIRSKKHKIRYISDLKYKNRFYSYIKNNKAKIANRMRVYSQKRSKHDNLFHLRRKIGAAIRSCLNKNYLKKKSKTKEILGCSFEYLKSHIESQFLDGMSWENKNQWHVDHIIPVSCAKTESALIALNHYTNLRPLWASENIRKSNKILPEHKEKYECFKKRFDTFIPAITLRANGKSEGVSR